MTVSVRTADRITTVTIERPERRNAVDLPTARALLEAFQAFDADRDARRGRRRLHVAADCRLFEVFLTSRHRDQQ